LKSKTTEKSIKTKKTSQNIRRAGRFFNSAQQLGLNPKKDSQKSIGKKNSFKRRRNGKLFSEIEIEKLKNQINNFEENQRKFYESL